MVDTRLTQAGATYHEPCDDIARLVRDYTIGGVPQRIGSAGGYALSFDGDDDKAVYRHTARGVKTAIIRCRVGSDTEAICDFDGNTHYLDVSSGTFRAQGFTSPTLYVDGAAGSSVSADEWVILAATTDTAFDADAIGLGWDGSAYGDVDIDWIALFPWEMSAAESDSIYDGSAFGYSRIIHNDYDVGGGRTYSPFTAAQETNIAANLKSDGSTPLGLTTLQINDFKARWGIA